ncbi:hypothetical protein KJ841_01605 [Patescibacteria group bacterium]|nr:hypothetical protein [Patescibacteria group bacterium]
MNEESTKYLDDKFNKIDERFDKIDEDVKEIKKDVGINKTNILVGFEDARKERARIEAKIDRVYNAVDGFTKIVTKLQDEFTAMKEDLKRVKLVIKEKLGVDLT